MLKITKFTKETHALQMENAKLGNENLALKEDANKKDAMIDYLAMMTDVELPTEDEEVRYA